MTSSKLKIIAIITMLIDHIGAIFYPNIIMLRIIGRISFPIFAFLIAEGYVHTKNLKQYIFRLFIFALISEIPYDFAFEGKIFDINNQNVLFTFVLALIFLYITDLDKNKVLQSIGKIAVLITAMILHVDYSFYGIFMVVAFYKYREDSMLKYSLIAFINLFIVALTVYYIGFTIQNIVQGFAVFSIPILIGYNGKKGMSLKYLFYLFYPVHLMIYGIINAV